MRSRSLILVAVWQLILKKVTKSVAPNMAASKVTNSVNFSVTSDPAECLDALLQRHSLVQIHQYNGKDVFSCRYLEVLPFCSVDVNSDGY